MGSVIKNKSCQKKASQKMINLFDKLPLDVIKYEIIPYIANDYFGRMGINFLLPPIDRQSNPLRHGAVTELGISLSVVRLSRLIINATNAQDQQNRAEEISETFKYLIINPLLLQHNMSFRNTALAKALTFADPDCNQYTVLPEANKANLVTKSCQLLAFAATKPYLYHSGCAITKDSKWSPVEGAGSHVVVNNEKALIAAEKVRKSKPHWHYFSRGMYRYDYEDDQDGDWEYGYFDVNEKWVSVEQEQEQEKEQVPVVSRRGTVLGKDGWETVVSKRRR